MTVDNCLADGYHNSYREINKFQLLLSLLLSFYDSYMYGEPVKGKAAIETGVIFEKKYRPIRTDHTEQSVNPKCLFEIQQLTKHLLQLVDGVARFRLPVEKIEQGLPYGFPLGGILRVRAIVTSEGVSLTEEASIEKTVFSAKSVLLDMSRSRAFFKPGLMYDLEVCIDIHLQTKNKEEIIVW